MATKQLEQLPQDEKVRVPSDAYDVRIISSDLRNTQKTGNPMLVLEYEIVGPQIKRVAGKDIEVLGHTAMEYVVLYDAEIAALESIPSENRSQSDSEALERARKLGGYSTSKLAQIHQTFGLPLEIDESMIDKSIYEGQMGCVLLRSEAIETKGSDGKVILDANGKPLVNYGLKVQRYLGPCRFSDQHGAMQ